MSSALPPGPGGPQDVKLTEQEQHLVAKLLSDPTYFPLEFRTWLKNYIEGAGIMVTTSQVRGSSSSSDRTGLPAGLIIPVGGTAAVPVDTKVCDGAAYLRAIEAPLFSKIGTTWGSPTGDSFNVPDLRDRSLFGAGSAIGVGQSDGHPFGSRGGFRHRHTFVNPTVNSHDHGGSRLGGYDTNPGTGSSGLGGGDRGGWGPLSAQSPGTSGGKVGIDGTNLDGPSWAGVIWVITTGKAA